MKKIIIITSGRGGRRTRSKPRSGAKKKRTVRRNYRKW